MPTLDARGYRESLLDYRKSLLESIKLDVATFRPGTFLSGLHVTPVDRAIRQTYDFGQENLARERLEKANADRQALEARKEAYLADALF